jgi:NRAMP (natural resistance-associated macrophage protein)-like metal ion transporter
MPNPSTTSADKSIAWYQRIGPGLITACVVIGPGSILTSSTVGANNGYSMLWVVIVAVLFMSTYMTMAAKLGAVADGSPGDLVRRKAGRPMAIVMGCIVFVIAAAYQSSNNIGVAAAFEAFIDSKPLVAFLVVLFNVIAISFLYLFKNLYRFMEKLMMVFVAVMLISFTLNLFTLRPDPVAMAKGFIPSAGTFDIALLGLIGTTFVITGAFYQAYLVRQKGWNTDRVRSSILDARVGAVIMALITIILMSTAAAGLYTGSPVVLADPVAVAESLEPTFGATGKIIFCLGLFSAAYSSFLINSMTGGFIASDGFGLGSGAEDRWPRLLTAAGLLTGMVVALAAMVLDFDRTPTIIVAQATAVIGAPLVAAVLFWLTSSKDVMGKHANGLFTNILAGIGLLVLLAVAVNIAAVALPEKVQQYRESLRESV